MYYWEIKQRCKVLVAVKCSKGINNLDRFVVLFYIYSLSSGPDDNVFVYFTDHGATGKIRRLFVLYTTHSSSFFLTGLVAFPTAIVSLIQSVLEEIYVDCILAVC